MNTPPPGDADSYEIDIHGKLSHLDAVDLSALNLNQRYAMITLSGPWSSDDRGRFTTSGGAYPYIPGLSPREALDAVRGLIAKKLMRTWTIGGTTCWEVAGAYAFKPGLKQAMWDRKQLAIRKRRERELRRERRKDAELGIPFAKEDDGGGVADDGVLVEKIRTKRGNLVPKRAGLWFRSKVPVPKSVSREKMLIPQPEKYEDIKLRMLPSFNPGDGLSVLGTLLRHYLLMDCDDYGRVRLDVPQLWQQLGSVITKRINRAQVEAELAAMIRSGHLMEIRKKSGRYAFVRDSAQHMLKSKGFNRDLPKLMEDDREYTHDSESYLAFFKACKEHSTNRTTVRVGEYNERGDIHAIEEYVDVAADRFVKEYQELMKKEPWLHMTPHQFCTGEGLSDIMWHKMTFLYLSHYRFWHAVTCNLPVDQLVQTYLTDQEDFDQADGKTHKILTELLGMTPKAYIEKRTMGARLDSPPPPPPPAASHTLEPST